MGQDRFVTHRRHKNKPIDMPEKDFLNERKRSYNSIKPATYDGSGSWHDYRAHFEACAKINEWTEEQKGLYLSVSLRGQAQGVFGNLG
ncbi:hypothetical protein DPMN_182563 [Dreissena polymorpha]|uniref:Uncharacterized protein n=1 Tax=Dreissena polymorpha TaxID=45954 RepID=A0A9D4DFV9_DREPO|nr:hypothetical protein DPMN_182563 [Dreissena polymorpha]